MLIRNRIYKNIQNEERILGLDVPDFFFVMFVYMFSAQLIPNILISIMLTLITYCSVYYLKKDKPSGWTNRFIRFQRQPRVIKPPRTKNLNILTRRTNIRWRNKNAA